MMTKEDLASHERKQNAEKGIEAYLAQINYHREEQDKEGDRHAINQRRDPVSH